MLKGRLSTQVAVVTFSVLALLASLIMGFYYLQAKESLPKQAALEAKQASAMIAVAIAEPVIYGQLYPLWSRLKQFRQDSRESALLTMTVFAVVNNKHQILSHSDSTAHPLMSRLALPEPGVHWLGRMLTVVSAILHPTSGRELGHLALTFDATSIDMQLAALRWQLFLGLILSLLLALAVALGMRQRVSKPLRILVEEAEKVGDGSVDDAAFEDKPKEIRELAAALKQADATVQQSIMEVKQLAEVVRQASELVILTDPDGVILYVNPAFERVSGYSFEEAVGKTPRLVKSGEHDDAYYAEMWQTLKSGKVWHDDFKNRRKDGSIYEVEQSIFPIFDGGNKAVGFAAVQRDVTEQRGIEKKLRHADRVESLGVLAGGIAHDFNNLLTAILGNAGLAQKKLDDFSPAKSHIESIIQASQSAADLCRQMLAYSGKGKFIVRPVNLSELVEGMGKLITISIPKHVTMRYELDDAVPLIDADIAQIQQVVLNLITNAAEAIGEERGIITLATGRVSVDATYLSGIIGSEHMQPGEYACLEVSDTGCGMTPEIQKKIFDPFFTTKFSGRGLGMSAMLGIVRGHKGGMRIYSEPGQGTSIKVAFPISKQSQIDLHRDDTQQAQSLATGAALVIDDEPHIREVAVAMLEDIGFAPVYKAEDGAEGVECYRAHRDEIEVVLLDMTMPRMNGESCFRELRKIDPDVRVILSSGYNEQDATNRFVGKGLAGFIQKPYAPNLLAAKVDEALRRD